MNATKSWLDTLLERIDEVSEEQQRQWEPAQEVVSNETVVGVADARLRGLYIAYLQAHRQVKEFQELLDALDRNRSNAREVMNDAAHAAEENELLRHMFWHSCAHAFPVLKGHEAVGIREGWKIVVFESEEQEPMMGGFALVIGVG